MLVHRPRRLRRTAAIRNLIRETNLSRHDFVLPLFVSEKIESAKAIPSMPGVHQYGARKSPQSRSARTNRECKRCFSLNSEVEGRTGQWRVCRKWRGQNAVRQIKERAPDLTVITDVCLCEYTSHGHCGVTRLDGEHFHVLNDESVQLIAKTAVSQAAAGADMVAPSDMMDGRIGAVRAALDQAGFDQTGIMSYAAKFASVFYGPFRDAAESPPQFGDRRSYQMDPANADEALREVELDLAEGADIVLVKPALPYLDILWRVRERFGRPTAVYHVSGEFAMVKAAAEKGLIDERAAALEIMTSLKRAGADFIVSYWALDLMEWLKS